MAQQKNALAPPKDLTADGKKLWQRVVRTLEQEGRWRPGRDIDVVERYVRAVMLGRQARAQVDADGLVVEGSQEQLRPHPLLKVIDQADRSAQAYFDRLFPDDEVENPDDEDELFALARQFHEAATS